MFPTFSVLIKLGALTAIIYLLAEKSCFFNAIFELLFSQSELMWRHIWSYSYYQDFLNNYD